MPRLDASKSKRDDDDVHTNVQIPRNECLILLAVSLKAYINNGAPQALVDF